MKYVALEFFGKDELTGIRAQMDDLSLKHPFEGHRFESFGNDSVDICRRFSRWCESHFPYNNQGKTEIVAFGVIEPHIFQGMSTFHSRIRIVGGVLNPWILQSEFRPGNVLTCEEIIRMIRLRLKSQSKMRR